MKKVGKIFGRHKGITALALILVVLIVAAAVTGTSRGVTAGYSEEAVSLRNITTYNSFVGNVTVASEMSVYPQASQTVTEVYVSEGDEVEKGDVLAQLDTSTVEYNIEVQEAGIASSKTSNDYSIADAQRTYDNYKEAVDSGLNSSLQSAQNQVDSAYNALVSAYESYSTTLEQIDNGTYSGLSSYWTEKQNTASAVSSAEAAVSTAQSTVTAKENALASAKSTLANAQTALESLQSSSANAQTELTAAQSQLSMAQSDYNNAETSYNSAYSAYNNAVTALNNAATEEEKAQAGLDLETAETALSSAEASLNAFQLTLNTAQAAVDTAQAAVDSLTQAQEAVTNAQSAVNTAQSELTSAQSALSSAQSTLDSANDDYYWACSRWAIQRENTLNDLQNNIDSAQMSYDQALASYDSTELSVNQQLESYAASVDKSKATSSTATSELELQNLKDSLEDYTITAPCDGTITELDLEVGDTVSTGMSVATISNLSAMEISISVDEYSVLNTGVGSPVTIYIDSIDKTYEGTIIWVADAATTSGGVSYFEATVSFTPDDDVKVGMSVEVRLITVDQQNVVSVAAASVSYHSDNTAYVLVEDENGNAVERTVSIGASDGNYVEITEGLEEGDIILTTAGSSGLTGNSAMEMIGEQDGAGE